MRITAKRVITGSVKTRLAPPDAGLNRAKKSREENVFMKLLFMVLCGVTALMPLAVSAEYYKYVDKNGNVSFTDNILSVPEDQRQNAETKGNRSESKEKVLDEKTGQEKSPSKFSPKDLELIKRLTEGGLIDKGAEQEITPEKLQELKIMLKLSYGIDENDIGKRDARFSSPEATWSIHRQALINGDVEAALACFVPNSAKDYGRGYRELGKQEMKRLAREMKPIEKITQDNQYAKYRIIRDINGSDITFYIYFLNVMGNWKIDHY
jgi:hypothetical protein